MASESKGRGKRGKSAKAEDASAPTEAAPEADEAAPESEAAASEPGSGEAAAPDAEAPKTSKPARSAKAKSTKAANAEPATEADAKATGADSATPPTERAAAGEAAPPAAASAAAGESNGRAKPKAQAGQAGGRKAAAPQRHVHLITGFPGFIGRRLVRKLGVELHEAHLALLVQAHLRAQADKAVAEAVQDVPSLAGRVELITGDITEPDLGIAGERLAGLLDEVTVVWHLAAVYDLAVSRAVAYRVNVVGTANVLDLCERLPHLERLNYVSTCYVAGEREGLILETELDEGQAHKNHYESTKFWAEVEVQRRWDQIPTTVYRPGIVVGDSRTGETDKYDGPYYFIRLLQRLPDWMPMVNVGEGEALVNLVPVDYLVDALVAISRNPAAVGKVVQLADPNPMRARDLVALIMKVMGRRTPVGAVPSAWLDRLLRVRRLRQLLGMPREVLIYFNHPARFDVTQAQELLAGTGVRCPHISTYVRTLVDYVRRNPNKGFLDQRSL